MFWGEQMVGKAFDTKDNGIGGKEKEVALFVSDRRGEYVEYVFHYQFKTLCAYNRSRLAQPWGFANTFL